ncbi:MAG: SPFH domain-containing protein [Methanosarcinales archaeon]
MDGINLNIILLVLVIAVLIVLAKSIKIVKQHEKGIVESFGKYKKTTDSGLKYITPFIEELIPIDMREHVINVEPQEVITRDNVSVLVDAVVYFKIVDPVKSRYEITNLEYACVTLAQTNLRNIIGDMALDDTLTSRDKININLRDVLDSATDAWGVKITRVEVQKIDPPADITDAMSKQMKAEREKRAMILEAEGYKQSKIERAEGDKQSEIKRAEGDAQAKILRAQADAQAIQLVSEAANTYFKGNAQELKKYEVLSTTLNKNTKIVLPSDSTIMAMLGMDSEKVVPIPMEKK